MGTAFNLVESVRKSLSQKIYRDVKIIKKKT